MNVIFFGTPQFAVPSLDRLMAHPEFDVMAVVTQPDKRRGRGNQLLPSPIKSLALDRGLPVWQPRSVKKDVEALQQLRSAGADAFVVVAYGQILSQQILDMPRLGCVNAHGSLLPQYRGAAPIQWCLYHGESKTGVTTMLMDAGMDTGAMLLKATTPIDLMDNAVDLAKRLSVLSADLLVETLLGLDSHTVTPVPQDNAQASYASLIQKSDYQIDWSRSAIALHNQIRGFFPNCVTTFRQTPLKVTATLPLDGVDPSQLPDELRELKPTEGITTGPGTVIGLLKNQGAIVQTGEGRLLLREVQLAGKKAQSGWDFVNGARLESGELLGA